MAQQGYVFDERSMRLVVEMVKRELKRPQSTVTRNTQRPTAYKYTRLAKLTTALAEGSGETATATLMRLNSAGTDWEVGSSPEDDFQVMNFWTKLSAEIGTRIICVNMFGKWVVDDTDCEAEA